MGKMLCFIHRGETFAVSLAPETLGHVIRSGQNRFALPHPSWKIIGVSFHHWRQGIDIPITPNVDPKSLIRGRVWDVDHGTTRRWSGRYCGKPPRITSAWIEENPPEKG